MKADGVAEFVIGDNEGAVLDLLRSLQRAALLHPEATRALFNALAAEGRAFAETTEGRRWKEQILSSILLERAVLVWQSAVCFITEDGEQNVTPSALIDAVAAAAASSRRDVLLGTLFSTTEEEA